MLLHAWHSRQSLILLLCYASGKGTAAAASEGPVAFQVALDIYSTKDSLISQDRNEHFEGVQMLISGAK